MGERVTKRSQQAAATAEQLPLMVGLIAMGSALACLIGFVYSVLMLRSREPKAVASKPPAWTGPWDRA